MIQFQPLTLNFLSKFVVSTKAELVRHDIADTSSALSIVTGELFGQKTPKPHEVDQDISSIES